MLTNIFENRGKEFSNLLKLGDYLGRALRENVELFSLDKGRVTYLTESGMVVEASYSFKPTLKLYDIAVGDASIFETEEAFNEMTNKRASKIISSLLKDSYVDAQESFDSLLDLYETKLSYTRIKSRLEDKVARFGDQTNIVNTKEFKKLSEMRDKLVKFLKENQEIKKIAEVKNGLKLASVVAAAFNCPKITIDTIKESKVFEAAPIANHSVYEHVCRQELIRKELLEAKTSLDSTWANNDLVAELASMVYDDASKVEEKVAELINELPYFALATKGQISNLLKGAISLSELDVSDKSIAKHVSRIYEMKKGVKEYILTLLNEKYGINVNNLTEVPSFSNLIKTEMVLFQVLAKLAPKDSVLAETLSRFGKSLKIKNGVEAIDVITFLNEVFKDAGYASAINETSLMSYLDFNQVADDLGKIGTILKLIRPVLQGGAGGGMPPTGADAGGMGMAPTAGADPMAAAGLGGKGIMPPAKPPQGVGGAAVSQNPDDEGTPMGAAGDPEEAAVGAESEFEMGGDDPMNDEPVPGEEDAGMEDDLDGAGMPGEELEEPGAEVDASDIASVVKQIEDLLAGINTQIGGAPDELDDGDMPIEGEEEMDGEFDGGEGEFDPESEDGGEGFEEEGDGDGVHIDIDSHDDESGDEEEPDFEEDGAGEEEESEDEDE